MGKLGEPRITLIVETYYPSSTAGRHGEVHVRPVAGQGYDGLLVRCNKGIHEHRPVGTSFRIQAMLTQNRDGTKYFSSHYNWRFDVLPD
jgi:hypothetical protein